MTDSSSPPLSISRLGLSADDLQNKALLTVLRREWPQVIERLLAVKLISRPDVPYYRMDELAQKLVSFGKYLRVEFDAVMATGKPENVFDDSPWLHAGLSNLYPDTRAFSATPKSTIPIVRREVLEQKISVVEYLARALVQQDEEILGTGFALATEGRTSANALKLDAVENLHWERQRSARGLKSLVFAGGVADVVRLVTYCDKEISMRTFHDAKRRLEQLCSESDVRSYADVSRHSRRTAIRQVLDALVGSVRDEPAYFDERATALWVAQQRAASPSVEPPRSNFEFRRSGNQWFVRWNRDRWAHFPDLKGMIYIAELLRHEYEQVAVSKLYSDGEQAAWSAATSDEGFDGDLEGFQPDGQGYDQTGPEYIKSLRAEIKNLNRKISDEHDTARRKRLREDVKTLRGYLSQAEGSFGRRRKFGDLTEQRRKSVTQAIRYAIKQINGELPECAKHLRSSIKTGTSCHYSPRERMKWSTD